MTDSTTYPAPDIASLNVRIAYRSDAPLPEVRDAAERSVAALVTRASAALGRSRRTEAERDKLAAAVNQPLIRVMEGDPSAGKALAALSNQQPVEERLVDALRRESTNPDVTQPGHLVTPAAATHGLAPYDFSWSWHDTNGYAPFDQELNVANGLLGLDARSGAVSGGKSGFVNAHAGFGLYVTTGNAVTAQGVSLRNMRWSYAVGAAGVGSNATSEGGMEFTAFEDGNLIAASPYLDGRLWRRRVSGSFGSPVETASDGMGTYTVWNPYDLYFPMKPGHGYTFNVGAWVYTDRSFGVGAGAAQSLIEGNVFALNVWR